MSKMPLRFPWIDRPLTDWAIANIERAVTLHPGRQVGVVGQEVLWPGWKTYFDQADRIGPRVDLLKLSVMRRLGGWVADADVWFLRPLEVYEQTKPLGEGHWFGTRALFLMGGHPSCDWKIVDEALAVSFRPHEHNGVFRMMERLSKWDTTGAFDACVPAGEMCLPISINPSLYTRLVNGQPSDIGTLIAIHGHKNVAPIPDTAIA